MLKRNLKVTVMAIVAVLVVGLIVSYAATQKQSNSSEAGSSSANFMDKYSIGMSVSDLTKKLTRDKIAYNEQISLNMNRPGSFVHTKDADYYFTDYDSKGKSTEDSTVEKIYLSSSYNGNITKDLMANYKLPDLIDMSSNHQALAANITDNGANIFMVAIASDGFVIEYCWENGIDSNTQVPSYICIEVNPEHLGKTPGRIDGLEEALDNYTYNATIAANNPQKGTDDSFDDDPALISEFDYKTQAAKNTFNLSPDDVFRDWDKYQGYEFAFDGKVTYISKDDYTTTLLLDTYQGGTIACTFYENVPVVENDYLAVWGWATELTTYTTTNEYGVTKNHNTFLLEGRYYETEKVSSETTQEISLTENTINGEPYYIKDFKRETNGRIVTHIVLSNYEGYYFNAGGYHGTIVFYPSGRIAVDDLRAFDGTNGFSLSTIDYSDGLPATYVNKDL